MDKNYQPNEAEKRWMKLWAETGIYKFKPDSNDPVFSVDTPPPYVSSDHLHIGRSFDGLGGFSWS
ncbi:MAG: hypothetical protein WC905_03410 [Patescibacteria group bacterium]|jgi:valyl-tRNA synthetase